MGATIMTRKPRRLSVVSVLALAVSFLTCEDARAQACVDYVLRWGGCCFGDGEFTEPHFIAVDPRNNDIYVADRVPRLQKFTDSGVFITKWSSYGPGAGGLA